jgi:hypothetical protein
MGITSSGTATPFIAEQDRNVDALTVQRYCTGCPFKAVRPRNRNEASTGSSNITEWGNEGLNNAPILQTQYYCTSPNWDTKKQNFFLNSSTIGFGYCPFFLDKWKQLESGHDPDDTPMA